MKLLSDDGIRQDGRYAHEIREISFLQHINNNTFILDYLQGGTSVSVVIDGPKERVKNKNKISLKLKFSNTSRNEINVSIETINELLKKITNLFETVILISDISVVDVDVCINNDDGSLYSCIVNSIGMALCCAGIPMKDVPISLCIGYFNRCFVFDLCSSEENSKFATFDIVYFANTGNIAYFKLNGRMEIEGIDFVFKQGLEGMKKIFNRFSEFTVGDG